MFGPSMLTGKLDSHISSAKRICLVDFYPALSESSVVILRLDTAELRATSRDMGTMWRSLEILSMDEMRQSLIQDSFWNCPCFPQYLGRSVHTEFCIPGLALEGGLLTPEILKIIPGLWGEDRFHP